MTRLALAAVSYSRDGAAEATGCSRSSIDNAIAAGDLTAHYLGTKPLIRAVDLDDWIRSLPEEKPARSA